MAEGVLPVAPHRLAVSFGELTPKYRGQVILTHENLGGETISLHQYLASHNRKVIP
jgi:hypothetical protein